MPAGLSGVTSYFLRDVIGNSFKIAATRGGSVIDLTDSRTISNDQTAGVPGGVMSNTTMASGLDPGAYPTVILASMRWSKALGIPLPTGLENAMETYRATEAVSNWGNYSSHALLNTFEA